MPAFDPVRDAVLNSPTAQAPNLPSALHGRLQPTLPSSSPHLPHNHTASPSASPTVSRRATDLAVLLNSEYTEPAVRTPPPARSSTLSRILHSDTTEDKLTTSEPLRRSSNSTWDPVRDSAQDPSLLSASSTHSSHYQTPSPTTSIPNTRPPDSPSHSSITSRPSSSSSSVYRQRQPSPPLSLHQHQDPAKADMQILSLHYSTDPPRTQTQSPAAKPMQQPSPPPRVIKQAIPYQPKHRITPAGSVLIPMTPEEQERYRDFRGEGSQKLMMKRKRGRSNDSDDRNQPPTKKQAGDVNVIMEHYNSRPEVGVVQRQESPIIGLKNFNNWVKSVLITQFAHAALAASPSSRSNGRGSRPMKKGPSGKVLDMGCGKGGDITKWSKARVKELFGVDIAAVSIDQARQRWQDLKGPKFEASFEALDCFTEPLSKVFPPAKLAQPFDVVSMQFCMHYAFETLQKTRCMLDNVSRYLRPGGVFIGTVPNAEFLLERLASLPEDASDLSFGNDVYNIRFEQRHSSLLFGHRYWFTLKDAVNGIPEYVVHWDNFVQLAAEYRLHPIFKQEFHDVFDENQTHPEFRSLMIRMNVMDSNGGSQIDESQWEAANIYIAFAFEKR
ncbi:hypothetical protein AX16_010499 [Volvariella volvacea WC 439]|nr:hypothetical protein AX16_010499 [Volvariella volvacea WC 439]